MRWIIEKIVLSSYFQELLQGMLVQMLVESGVYKIGREESVIVIVPEDTPQQELADLHARLTHIIGDGRFVLVGSNKPISLIKVA